MTTMEPGENAIQRILVSGGNFLNCSINRIDVLQNRDSDYIHESFTNDSSHQPLEFGVRDVLDSRWKSLRVPHCQTTL